MGEGRKKRPLLGSKPPRRWGKTPHLSSPPVRKKGRRKRNHTFSQIKRRKRKKTDTRSRKSFRLGGYSENYPKKERGGSSTTKEEGEGKGTFFISLMRAHRGGGSEVVRLQRMSREYKGCLISIQRGQCRRAVILC